MRETLHCLRGHGAGGWAGVGKEGTEERMAGLGHLGRCRACLRGNDVRGAVGCGMKGLRKGLLCLRIQVPFHILQETFKNAFDSFLITIWRQGFLL